MMVSALTVLGLREEESRYGSYAALAEAMMHPGWHDGPAQMRELFTRAVLNVAVGKHDGTIIQFLGDSIFAMWNAPVSDERHAEKACRAALARYEHVVGEGWPSFR